MVAVRSSGRRSLSEPFWARPIGVRAVATMTASGMVDSGRLAVGGGYGSIHALIVHICVPSRQCLTRHTVSRRRPLPQVSTVDSGGSMAEEIPQRLTGKVAIVTGASRGIGLGVARRLVAEGARVCLTARGAEALAEAVQSLGGPEVAIGVPGKGDDVAHQADAIAEVEEAFGPVDILVNNTGINPVFGRMVDLDLAAARKILD